MIDKIDDNLYRIRVVMPANLMGSTNAYVLKGSERSLIVDTGMDLPESLHMLQAGLKELSVDLRRSDIFITHYHKDHIGLAGRLASENTRIFLSSEDFDALEEERTLNPFLGDPEGFSFSTGFPMEGLLEVHRFFHPYEKATDVGAGLVLLGDGDRIDLGDRRLTCILTPGHSRGHMCLYERERRILFSGDHVIGDITPTIQGRFNGKDPLKVYLESLRKVRALDVAVAFPGHREPIADLRARVDELLEHHALRNEETLSILKRGPAKVYEIASQMTWSVDTPWEDLDYLQRFLAVGEAISHLNFLEGQGKVRREGLGQETELRFIAEE